MEYTKTQIRVKEKGQIIIFCFVLWEGQHLKKKILLAYVLFKVSVGPNLLLGEYREIHYLGEVLVEHFQL